MVELDRRALLVRGGLASGIAATGAIIAGCTTPEVKNAAAANTASTEQADTETFLKIQGIISIVRVIIAVCVIIV